MTRAKTLYERAERLDRLVRLRAEIAEIQLDHATLRGDSTMLDSLLVGHCDRLLTIVQQMLTDYQKSPR